MNKVTLYGRLGDDPELQTINGTDLAKFSLATSESWKDKSGEKQEKTEWHRIEAWGKTADIVGRFLHKGDPVLIEGSIRYTTTGEGADKKYFTSIRCDRLHLMPKSSGQSDKSAPTKPTQAEPDDNEPDDLPF